MQIIVLGCVDDLVKKILHGTDIAFMWFLQISVQRANFTLFIIDYCFL
jgi:hypothetical protein